MSVMSGPVPPVHLVLGDEEFLATRAVQDVVSAVRAAEPACEVREVDGGELVAGQLAELFSPSLFGEVRVLVVRSGQDTARDVVAALLAEVAAPPDGTVVVVAHAGGAKGKALVEGLRAAGARIVLAGRLTKQRDRVAFVRDEIARHGGRCGEEVATRILDAVGNDLRELASTCAQLVADTGGRVDAHAVRRYHRGRAEVTGFTVADAVMVGDPAGALEALRWALAVGVDPVPIADALADGVRTVARVAGGGRSNSYQLASVLGLPPWKVERAQRQAKGWTPTGLSRAMRTAADLNAEVKGGVEDRGHAVERAVLAIIDARDAR